MIRRFAGLMGLVLLLLSAAALTNNRVANLSNGGESIEVPGPDQPTVILPVEYTPDDDAWIQPAAREADLDADDALPQKDDAFSDDVELVSELASEGASPGD